MGVVLQFGFELVPVLGKQVHATGLVVGQGQGAGGDGGVGPVGVTKEADGQFVQLGLPVELGDQFHVGLIGAADLEEPEGLADAEGGPAAFDALFRAENLDQAPDGAEVPLIVGDGRGPGLERFVDLAGLLVTARGAHEGVGLDQVEAADADDGIDALGGGDPHLGQHDGDGQAGEHEEAEDPAKLWVVPKHRQDVCLPTLGGSQEESQTASLLGSTADFLFSHGVRP